MNHKQPIILPNCPQCGKKEGAFMGNTRWNHNDTCCSEECGLLWYKNPKRWFKERNKLIQRLIEHDERFERLLLGVSKETL
jgi:hypothetical protein